MTTGAQRDGRRQRRGQGDERAVVDDEAPTLADRVTAALTRAQHTRAVRALMRYIKARGGLLAGGITYSALFSVFAALTIGYTAFMAVLGERTELRESVITAVNNALPGIIDTGKNDGLVKPDALILDTALSFTSIVALAVLLWTAISMMKGVRRSVRAMFGIVTPKENFVLTKGRDLLGFLGIALALVLTAGLTIAAGTAGGWVMALIGVTGAVAAWSLRLLGLLVALAVDMAVIMLLVRGLAGVRVPRRDLLLGALLGGIASGALRVGGTTLVGSADNPLLAAAGALITILLWLNLLSRVFLVVAAWMANPPAPPKPLSREDTRFDEDPNYVTLSVPGTLDWNYQATTGVVEVARPRRRAAREDDLRALGEGGEEILARHREDERVMTEARRHALERAQHDAHWGGLIGRLRDAAREWTQRSRRRRWETEDAVAKRDEERRRLREGR